MSESPARAPVTSYRDAEGRCFEYVHLGHNPGGPLVIHFSAFFGKWGNARAYRARFQGYFHRLKLLGGDTTKNWLFLCDPCGAFENGSYYTGAKGDFFVERAMLEIIDSVCAAHGYEVAEAVTAGSSMGGTAALKFGLMRSVRGIVAVGPHIDLDISAKEQDRVAEVAWICPDGDPFAESNRGYTRQIRALLAETPPGGRLPLLFVQSCADDVGVHAEQVLPLVDEWRRRGGRADLDTRPTGGHTSDYATRELLLDVVDRLQRGVPVDPLRYQTDPVFRGVLTAPPLSHRLRRSLSLARKRVRSALRRR